MKLAWSKLCIQELRELRRYSIDRWGHDVALRYLQDVRDAAKHAAADPSRARALQGDLRIVRVRSHCLIVHVNESTSTVTIARLLHMSMDIGAADEEAQRARDGAPAVRQRGLSAAVRPLFSATAKAGAGRAANNALASRRLHSAGAQRPSATSVTAKASRKRAL